MHTLKSKGEHAALGSHAPHSIEGVPKTALADAEEPGEPGDLHGMAEVGAEKRFGALHDQLPGGDWTFGLR
jgi:hypothetical protein